MTLDEIIEGLSTAQVAPAAVLHAGVAYADRLSPRHVLEGRHKSAIGFVMTRKTSKISTDPQIPALGSEEAQNAFNAVIDALSQWREDIARAAEKNSSKVYDELASAAEAMGWPEELVESIRAQLDKTTELQLHMIDQAMDAWVQQVKSPMATSPGLESFTSQVPMLQNPFFDLGKTSSGRPRIDPMAAMVNPMQAWVQAAEFWQNAWLQAFKGWSDMQRSAITGSSSLGRYRSH